MDKMVCMDCNYYGCLRCFASTITVAKEDRDRICRFFEPSPETEKRLAEHRQKHAPKPPENVSFYKGKENEM